MRVLLIGAHGFLGGHIQQGLIAAGWDVIAAGRSPRPGDRDHVQLDLSADGADHIAEHLLELAPDAVVNCAGAISGDSATLAAGNVIGPAALLAGLMRAKLDLRLLHLGSAAEYGAVEAGSPIKEDAFPQPVGTYGVTKLAGTRLVSLAREAGLDAAVLRVFNPVGPGSPDGSLPGRVAAEVARALASDDAVRLGPLDAVRDFVDARDVADAVQAALAAPVLDQPVLNIGSGIAAPARALVDGLLRISGFTGAVHTDAAGSPRSASVPWQQADISAAKAALHWRPRRDLATSLADLWRAAA